MTSKSIVLAWDQAPQWKKKAKTGLNRKNNGERSEPSGGLGSGKGPFPLPRLPLGSLRSSIFFLFPPMRSPGPRLPLCLIRVILLFSWFTRITKTLFRLTWLNILQLQLQLILEQRIYFTSWSEDSLSRKPSDRWHFLKRAAMFIKNVSLAASGGHISYPIKMSNFLYWSWFQGSTSIFTLML